jgi:SNF family Na+-dependent transporter
MLAWSLYFPLLLAAAIFAIISILAAVVRSRGNEASAEKLLDLGFVVAMAAGAWTLVLLVLAIFDEPDDIWDMVLIVLVVGAFFGILLGLLFVVFEWIFSRGGRQRAAPEEAPSPDTT